MKVLFTNTLKLTAVLALVMVLMLAGSGAQAGNKKKFKKQIRTHMSGKKVKKSKKTMKVSYRASRCINR